MYIVHLVTSSYESFVLHEHILDVAVLYEHIIKADFYTLTEYMQ